TSAVTVSVTNASISNAMLTTAPALTLKGNNSGVTASEQDLTVAQTVAMLGVPFANNAALTGIPTAPTQANYVASNQIANSAWVLGLHHNQLLAPTADVDWGGFKITNLGQPVNPNDAVTKTYVDTFSQGLAGKAASQVATTANLAALSGLVVIDGYTLLANDRVLVKDQTTQSQNGIYVAASGAWARALDMDIWAEVINAYSYVSQGTINGGSSWFVTGAAPGGVLGTTPIVWAQFQAAGRATPGAGLSVAGTTWSVVGTANRIVV